MKILYSHRTRSADGQYVHIRSLTDALRTNGHDLKIVGPEGVSEEATRTLTAEAGAPTKAQSSWKIPGPLYEIAELGYSLPAHFRLAKVAREFTPHLIYERYNLYYHAGLWLKKKLGIPYILEVNAPLREERTHHGKLALQGLAKHSEESLWRAADAILPVTGVLAQKLIDVGVDEEKITVIQNGIDAEFLENHNQKNIRNLYKLQNRLVLGFTGFVRDWHGVDRVLNFMAKNDEHNLHLLLVGDGPARESLEKQAQDLGLQDRLTITGIVQRDAVAAHVAAFDIALQPAVVSYASPLKLFEYMAMGKPILAPASANIMEVLNNGEDALLFTMDDDRTLDHHLKMLINQPDLRARLGHAARETLLRNDYSWAGNAKRIEAIAEKLFCAAP